VVEPPVQRSDAAVDPRPLAVLPDRGVDGKGEVDRGCALGEPFHVATRRENEDLVLVQVDLEELEELLGGVRVLLQLEELAEPRQVTIELVGTLPLLEQPVRCDPVLGGAVHLARADLDLVELAAGAEDRRVQRLVAVRLGTRGWSSRARGPRGGRKSPRTAWRAFSSSCRWTTDSWADP